MFKHGFIFLGIMLLLSGCGSDNNPLSAVGLGSSQKEKIDYSPRAPLVMPPAEGEATLPPPQDGMPQAANPPLYAPAKTEIAPPPSDYNANTPGVVTEEKSWWQRNIGN
ncbi:MAG: hypothetical protein V4691_05390 [Pseudomonadota bacterium]